MGLDSLFWKWSCEQEETARREGERGREREEKERERERACVSEHEREGGRDRHVQTGRKATSHSRMEWSGWDRVHLVWGGRVRVGLHVHFNRRE
jgi:hypothetical protein